LPESRILATNFRSFNRAAQLQTGEIMSTTQSDLFELAMSEEAQPLMAAVQNHITTHVEPITEEFYALDAEKT
jgi:hypothetical protein